MSKKIAFYATDKVAEWINGLPRYGKSDILNAVLEQYIDQEGLTKNEYVLRQRQQYATLQAKRDMLQQQAYERSMNNNQNPGF